MFQTTLDAALIEAYRETEYRVASDQPFTLRIGEVSAELQALQSRRRAEPCAYITACNPFSRVVSPSENAERHAQLGAELTKRGLTHIEGVGQHPSNNWPGEPSYLILGLDLEAARTLGMRMEQNAIVWIGADAVPELVLLKLSVSRAWSTRPASSRAPDWGELFQIAAPDDSSNAAKQESLL